MKTPRAGKIDEDWLREARVVIDEADRSTAREWLEVAVDEIERLRTENPLLTSEAYTNALQNRVIARCPKCKHTWFFAEPIGKPCPYIGCNGTVVSAGEPAGGKHE